MDHEIILSNPSGQRLALVDSAAEFWYVRALNNVGTCRIVLPESFDRSFIALDDRIEIWRSTEGMSQQLGFYGFVRRWVPETDDAGLTSIALYGVDLNDLLKRRIVAYAAGTAQALKTAKVDDMMKAIVRENMGSLAPAARDWTSAGFAVQADVSLGPTITKGFSWTEVLQVLQEISDASVIAGTPIYFDMVWSYPNTLEFQTFLKLRGNDHSLTSVQPLMIGVDFGTMAQPSLDNDYSDEVSHVYAGGQGEGTSRVIVEQNDSAREGASPFNRRESFADARNESTTAGITATAQAALQAGRPKRRFGGNLINAPGARFGIEWGFGDKVVATYLDQQYDSLVRAVTTRVDRDGNETVNARLEVVL